MGNVVNVLISMGNASIESPDMGDAQKYFEKAAGLSRGMKDMTLRITLGMGDVCFARGDFARAMEFHQKAAAMAPEVDDPHLTALSYARAAGNPAHEELELRRQAASALALDETDSGVDADATRTGRSGCGPDVASGKAEAPRAAQIELLKRYRHPYYWGAFILSGDP
jgi:hypothetical protein